VHGCDLRRRTRKISPAQDRRPTEYFTEHCYLSLDPDERTLAAMCEIGLDRNILWGSDFPHFDCTYPGVVKQVTGVLKVLPEGARRNIMTANPALLWNRALAETSASLPLLWIAWPRPDFGRGSGMRLPVRNQLDRRFCARLSDRVGRIEALPWQVAAQA